MKFEETYLNDNILDSQRAVGKGGMTMKVANHIYISSE